MKPKIIKIKRVGVPKKEIEWAIKGLLKDKEQMEVILADSGFKDGIMVGLHIGIDRLKFLLKLTEDK